jgi:putative ABC transport system permease protein
MWSKFAPSYPLDYYFLDDDFARLHQADQQLGRVFQAFALLAIGIACLGLFGLAAFTAERRTKEIGVRKVLGATVTNVVTLLSKDFVKLVLLANLIAWPLAWYAMNKWLQSFAFRVEMEWWVFALAGGLALLIALLTVSTQAIKAALANPVEALRYE